MATATTKKTASKRKIQARDVEVGNRSLEAVLLDLAERSARTEEIVAEARKTSARAEEMAAEALKTSARAEETAAEALKTIGSLLRDLHTLAESTDHRHAALENAAAE